LAEIASVYEEGEAEVTAIVQSYMRRCSDQGEEPQPEGDEEIMEFPIVLDDGSSASASALSLCIDRRASAQRVPEDVTDADIEMDEDFLKVSPPGREGEEQLTPEEFIRSIYKLKVLVRFNTHVFGEPGPGDANDDDDNGSPESDRVAHAEDEEEEDRKASDSWSFYAPERYPSTSSSFYAPERNPSTSSSFYAPERNPSISSSFYAPEGPSTEFSEFCYDDTVRNTVIQEENEDEEDDDATPRADPPISASAFFNQPADESAPAPPPALDTSEKTPDSVNTELITPEHVDVPLPIPPRGFSEEGYRRPGPSLHDKPTDRRFLPAKSASRPSTAPTGKEPKLKRSGGLARAPEIVCLPKRAKRISPPANEGEGLGLDTGRRSIDLDHERAIEHAGGTPGRTKRIVDDREAPPVPLLPDFLRDEPITDPEIMAAMAGPPRTSYEDCEEDMGPTDVPWPEDLAKIDKEMTIELEVTDNCAQILHCVLPVRRLSRPEFWQTKEDQALVKAIRWGDTVPPNPLPFQQTGAVVFGEAPKRRTQWLLFSGRRREAYLRGITIHNGSNSDRTSGKIKLNVDEIGVYNAFGYDIEGEVEWMFQYLVTFREPPSDQCRLTARVSHSFLIITIQANLVQFVYPMYFFATSAFLGAREGQDQSPFCKLFDIDDEAESELMPPPRVGRPPSNNPGTKACPPKRNESLDSLDSSDGPDGFEDIDVEFEDDSLEGETFDQAVTQPPTTRMGRVIKVITKIVRSRPNTPGSAPDKLPLTSTVPLPESSSIIRGTASATPPPRSAGLLGGLMHKLAGRSSQSGDVLISSSCHSAPVSHGSRSDLQLSRIDSMASVNTTKSGKSVKGIMSKLITKSSSRPGSAREPQFPRSFGNPQNILTGSGDSEEAILGRSRSKSAASRTDLYPKRPSSSRIQGQIIQGALINDSPKSDPGKSGKTMMDRLRTLSAGGSRPGSSRAKSPLSAESIIPVQTPDVEESAKGKGVLGKLRTASGGGSRPGSSRATPTTHPEFDLDELLKAREANGSAMGNHGLSPLLKPSKGPLDRVRTTSPDSRPGSSRTESPPPFVLQTTLGDPAFGSDNTLASLANSLSEEGFRPKTARGPSPPEGSHSPIPARGQAMPSSPSSRTIKAQEPKSGKFEYVANRADTDGYTGFDYKDDEEDTGTIRASSPGASSIHRIETSGGTEASRIAASWKRDSHSATNGTGNEIETKKARLSIASFNSLLTTTEDEEDDSESESGQDRQEGPRGSMDPAEVARRLQLIQQDRPTPVRQISIPVPRSNQRPTTSTNSMIPVKMGPPRVRPSTGTIWQSPGSQKRPTAGPRQPTNDQTSRTHRKALLMGESAQIDRAMVKFSTGQMGSTPRPAVWVDPASPSRVREAKSTTSQGKTPVKEVRKRTKSDRFKAKFGVRPSTPTVAIQEDSTDSASTTALPRTGRVISKIKSLSALNPNVQKPAPASAPSMPSTGMVSNIPRLVVSKEGITGSEYGPRYTKEQKGKGKASTNVPASPARSSSRAPQTESLWKKLTKPKSSASLKSKTPSPSTEIPPPLPRSAQPGEPALASRDDRPTLAHASKSADPSLDAIVDRPLLPHIARSAEPATSTSTSIGSDTDADEIYIAPTRGIVLMQNTAPPHLKNAHPFAIAMRPIQGQIAGSEWTHSNPQPTHYLVEDPVFKRAMEKHREEQRSIPPPPAMRLVSQILDSGPSSASSSATFGTGDKVPKPILRKRPGTTQVGQQEENEVTDLPRHLWPNKWDWREQVPSPNPPTSRGSVPPKRPMRPSTAQPSGHI
jgi:hypothetical protein